MRTPPWLFAAALIAGCAGDSRAWQTGCALGDAIGFDNGNLDANLCLPREVPHLPFLPVPTNRHQGVVLEGFEACYYDAYVVAYDDTIPMIDCD
jgi:hypothetical protein